MDGLRFEENQILFGADPTEGIVAAELAGRFIRLFIRDADGVRFKENSASWPLSGSGATA
jgi:DNA polymerase I